MTDPRHRTRQSRGHLSLLSPLHSLLSSGRSGLFGPPLCGGSAPATPPLLQHAWPPMRRDASIFLIDRVPPNRSRIIDPSRANRSPTANPITIQYPRQQSRESGFSILQILIQTRSAPLNVGAPLVGALVRATTPFSPSAPHPHVGAPLVGALVRATTAFHPPPVAAPLVGALVRATTPRPPSQRRGTPCGCTRTHTPD